jgi:trimeric autotransporter adhesin
MMKNLPIIGWVMVILFICIIATKSAFAQTPEQKSAITAKYNIPLLMQLENDFRGRENSAKAQALAFARSRNLPVIIEFEDGGTGELQAMEEDGTLIYYRTNNIAAAVSTRANHLNTGGSTGFNLDGQSMVAHVWDAGHARLTHQEYDGPGGNNRVSVIDATSPSLHSHAAHVTGTIMASGFVANAKGMAPQARVYGYNWTSDLSEATAAAANGMLLSNHSYGWDTNGLPDYFFGTYMSIARSWDELLFNAPYYLMVKSAGNDGTKNYNTTPLDPANPQYDKLAGISTAKNNLVIASANDASIDANGNLLNVSISSFSSQGPTDDLRIKPDITGNGAVLYSTYQGSDDAYGSISGTSMSAPNVTGTLLLLQQHAKNIRGDFLLAATLKGLVLHTADDAGMTGPDAIWGWGLLNAKKAAEAISNNGVNSLVMERELLPGETYTFTVNSDGINKLMASISWTDPAGTASSTLNLTTPILVNDLDIRVSRNGTTWYPWRLTGVNTNGLGDNIVDPYERVEVANASGAYTISVSHKGNLTNNKQNYSLIITGIINQELCEALVPTGLNISNVTDKSASVSWQVAQGTIYDIEYQPAGAADWITVTAYDSPYLIQGLSESSEYSVRIRSRCSNGRVSEFSTPINFTTVEKIISYCSSTALSSTEFINRVQVSGQSTILIDNQSGNNGGYTMFDFSGITLSSGISCGISITPGWTGKARNEAYRVWIDYNRDGIFDDTSELVYSRAKTIASPVSGNFTVPSSIKAGITRMRVSMKANNFPASCETNFNGEVEDYLITLGEPVIDNEPPSVPGSLAATNITHNSLDLSWSASTDNIGVTGYDVYMNGSLKTTSTGTNASIDGLSPVSSYSFYVMAKDAAGNISGQSTVISVTTLDFTSSYCLSYGAVNSAEYIQSVKAGTYLNNSGTNSGYGDFTSQTISLSRTGNTLTITPGWTGRTRSEAYRVWIDYNGDSDFDDAGELVFSQAKTSASSVTGSFAIPSGVTAKTTRMRVSMKFNNYPSPCETNFNGEVEDYLVDIPSADNAGGEISVKSATTGTEIPGTGLQEFKVYPNPANERLNMVFNGYEPTSVRIFNSTGQLVTTRKVENSIDISKLTDGLYIIELLDDHNTLARTRFMKRN